MDVDVNFAILPQERNRVLQKYTEALKQLRKFAEQTYHISPIYFDNYVLFQYFQQQNSRDGSGNGAIETVTGYITPWLSSFKSELTSQFLDRRRRHIVYWIFFVLLAFLSIFVYHNKTPAIIVESSMQSFANMRMWRRMTLPLIQRFPQLTELYDESCLMENPFFQVDDLNCERCARVENVLDLTKTLKIGGTLVPPHLQQTSDYVPFIYKIHQNPIQLNDFYEIYANNLEIFQRDAYRVQSTNRDITNLEELFSQFNNSGHSEDQTTKQQHRSTRNKQNQKPSQAHHLWRCNRMQPARLLRQLFASTLPSNGLALERFMAIDTSQAQAYTLPKTDCINVYVQQALGTRFIILRPTTECRHKCRTLSLLLPPSFVLTYNWWYWRPISAPDPVSDTLSISLIGSYC